MQTTLRRRTLLHAGGALLAGLPVLSLGGCWINSSASNATVPLRLEFWGTIERDKRTKEVISLFQQNYPTIKVTSQFEDFSSYWAKLGTEIAGGSEPDLLQMDLSYVAQYLKQNLLLDLTPYTSNTIDLSDFDPILLQGARVNNVLFGIPLGGNYPAAIYRTDLLQKAGLDVPDATMTWDEFARYATHLSQVLGPGVWGCEDGSNNGILFEIFVRQRGKELYTSSGQLQFSKQDLTDWWTYWSTMRASGACLPASLGVGAPATSTTTPSQSLLITGKVAFHFDWSNVIEAWQPFTPQKLSMTVCPQGGSGSQHGLYLKVSQLMSVSSRTNHPEEAVNFIDFMINNSAAIKALAIERGIPGSNAARALLKPELTPVEQEELNYITLAKRYARPKSVLFPAASGQIYTTLGLYASKVAFGQVSIRTGVDQFFAAAENLLSQGQSA